MVAIHAEDTVEVEYVGDPNPFDDIMKLRIAMGEIPEGAANVLRAAAIRRAKAIKGINVRVVDPYYFGVSKEYRFGPNSFKLRMDKRDYEKLKASPSAHQFKGPGDLRNALVLPRDGEEQIVLVKTENFDQRESVQLVQQSVRVRRR